MGGQRHTWTLGSEYDKFVLEQLSSHIGTVLEHTALVERYEQMYVQLRELSVDLDLQRVMDSLVLSAATLVNASKAIPRPKTNN